MLRRPLATFALAAGLCASAGCICFEMPSFPSVRGLFSSGSGSCPPGMICDHHEGPLLDFASSSPVPLAPAMPGVAEETMPQPRLVPQMVQPSSVKPPQPYVPKD